MSTVFISGVSRGIGFGLARKYLNDGHSVIGSVRTESESVSDLASEFEGSLSVVTLDVADPQSVERVARDLEGHQTSIDILICSAGVSPTAAGEIRPLAQIQDDDLINTFNVNVAGPLRLIRSLHGMLLRGTEPIVAILGSVAGSLDRTSDGAMVSYSVSKAAVHMLGLRMHHLLKEDGIRVLVLSPGWVKTDMGGPEARIGAGESADGIARVIEGFDGSGPAFLDYLGSAVPW